MEHLIMIPPRLIRCYRSKHLFTPSMLENERRLHYLHPEWEHLFFNHYQARDWVAEHTPEWIDLYNFYSLDRQREQIFRWLALWKLGGFWLGTKLRPLVSLETLRERTLVLAVQQRMLGDEFEALHRIPPPPDLPPAAMFRLADGGFGAEAGHWFVKRALDLIIDRAGYLDSGEPTAGDEDYTTGGGILNGAWLASLTEVPSLAEAALPAPPPGSQARPPALEPERAEGPSGLGIFGYWHTDLN